MRLQSATAVAVLLCHREAANRREVTFHKPNTPFVNLRLCVFHVTEREDRHDLLHSRLLPLHHKGARRAGQGPVEQHGEVTLLVFNVTGG